MRNRRRLFTVLALLTLGGLVLAPAAFASAGGGSSGYSGGDGGGGGGGGGFFLFFIFRALIYIGLMGHGLGFVVLLVLGLIYWFMVRGEPKLQRVWDERRRQGRRRKSETAKRERKVELAAAEAEDEDPVFGPAAVRADAAALFVDVQLAWDAADRVKLRELVAPDLYVEWERRLDDFDRKGWRNHSEPVGEPTVEYVGLLRREGLPSGESESGSGAGAGASKPNRVVVRIEAKIRDYVVDQSGRHIKREGQFTESVRMREYWTLERVDDKWMLSSIESGAEGEHQLQAQIVQNAWSDTGALRDESLIEGAVAESVPAGTKLAEVADLQFDGDARAAALDLSLADGRFAPDILEVAARRAVAAWADAVDGPDDPLLAVATPQAAHDLLYPMGDGDKVRMVVRGLSVKRIRIVKLDAAAEPATMTIDVDLRGRRYLEDRDTAAVLAGSPTRVDGFTERWTLAVTGDAEQPWRIVSTQTGSVAVRR